MGGAQSAGEAGLEGCLDEEPSGWLAGWIAGENFGCWVVGGCLFIPPGTDRPNSRHPPPPPPPVGTVARKTDLQNDPKMTPK